MELSLDARLISVRASSDDIVPTEYTVPASHHQYETFDVPGDHFTLIDPSHDSWRVVLPLLLQ